jgi:hypothetical protein
MSAYKFSPLSLAEWQPTLETLQNYAKVIGKVRRALTPPHKHWFHVSLRVGTTGLTTSPIPAGAVSFELLLDLTIHQLVITTSRGERLHKPLTGQSAAVFCEETLFALASLGFNVEIDRSLFEDTTSGAYDRAAVERYWQALSQIDAIFNKFKGEQRKETGPVQLWPHHIDLAMLWFSGRLIPGQDPENEEYADEQMNFGFSPGDSSIPNAYFYITAYPTPAGLTETTLPPGAEWRTEGFTGAVMMYDTLVGAEAPDEKLLSFLRTAQQAGARLMK